MAAWSSPGFIIAAYVYTASSGSIENVRSQARAFAGENETLRSDFQRLRESPDVVKARDEAASLRERLKAADDKLLEMAAIKEQLAVAESAAKISESRLNEAKNQLNDTRIDLGKLRAQGAVAEVSKPPDNERGWHAPPVTQAAPSPVLNACELTIVGKWHIDEPELERQYVKILAKFLFRPEADPRNQPIAHKIILENRSEYSRVAIEFKNDQSFLCWGVFNGNPMSERGTWSCSNNAPTFIAPTQLAYERPYVFMVVDTPDFGEIRIPFKKEGT